MNPAPRLNPAQRVTRPEDRDRIRRRVRAITTGTVAGAAVGAIALTVVIAGNADAGTSSGPTAPDNNSSQITVPPDSGSAGNSDDSTGSGSTGSGDQLVPAQQPPQFGGGGRSNVGSGGS